LSNSEFQKKKSSLNTFIFQASISVAANPQLDDLESVCLVSDGDIQETAHTVIKNEYMDITKQELDIAMGHGSMSFMFLP